MLTHHPWPQPAALTADGQRYQPRGPRDRLPIIRPVEPFENTAYNVTRSTARILRSEWGRAARLLEQGAGGEEVLAHLFAPVDLREESERFLVLSLTGDAAARADLAGQVEGHIVGLLIDLERNLHLHVRPWPEVYQQGSDFARRDRLARHSARASRGPCANGPATSWRGWTGPGG